MKDLKDMLNEGLVNESNILSFTSEDLDVFNQSLDGFYKDLEKIGEKFNFKKSSNVYYYQDDKKHVPEYIKGSSVFKGCYKTYKDRLGCSFQITWGTKEIKHKLDRKDWDSVWNKFQKCACDFFNTSPQNIDSLSDNKQFFATYGDLKAAALGKIEKLCPTKKLNDHCYISLVGMRGFFHEDPESNPHYDFIDFDIVVWTKDEIEK